MMSTQVETTRGLTSEELQYITGLRKLCQPKNKQPFVKMEDGDVRTFKFSAAQEDTRVVETEFRGEPQTRIFFNVIEDPNGKNEKATLALSRTHADLILAQIQKGNFMLDIERIGSGTSTNYRVKPSE